MKRFFSYLGVSTLVCLSFLLTEKTALVVKESDSLFQKIMDKSALYEVDSIDAVIRDDTIVPGINGRRVNVKRSYNEMKRLDFFSDKLLVYDDVFPSVSLRGNFDKYVVGGNPNKNMVSLIFMVYGDDDIGPILSVIGDIKVSFFVDASWFSNNNDLVLSLIKSGHTIGNLSNNLDYNDTSYVWMNNVLKMLGHQSMNFCYYSASLDNLKACALQGNYTIWPSVVGSNPLLDVKRGVKAGGLIVFDVNDKVVRELPLVISYIRQKGFTLSSLSQHLSENLN